MSVIKRRIQEIFGVGRCNQSGAPALMEHVEPRRLLAGTVTPKFVAVPIDAPALSADPSLANFKSYDLQVTVTGSNRWTAAQLLIKLKTGSFYIPSGAELTPQESDWSGNPKLKFHNFVSTSGFSDPIVLGGAQTGQQATVSSKEFSIAWGQIGSTATGTFTIARITIQDGSTGSLNGKIGTKDQPGVLQSFSSSVPFTGAGASITGYTWNDTNGDGGKNNGEVNMAGVQLYIDANLNGKLDPGEKSVRSRTNGNYTFSGLTGGGNFRVRETVPAGFRRTAPTDKSFWSVTLIDGAAASGKRFGNTQRALVTGRVWLDSNRDKSQNSGEPGLKGFTVWADIDGDNVIDSGETKATTGSDGSYALSLGAGTYLIRIQAKTGFKLTTPSGVLVALANGQTRPGVFFGERKA
jgi:hypothetical protein